MSKIIACSEVKLPVPRTYNVTVILETLGAMTKYYIWEKKSSDVPEPSGSIHYWKRKDLTEGQAHSNIQL